MENKFFFDALAGINFFDKEVQNALNKIVKREVFTRHQVILKSGEVSKYIWFINEGFAMAHIIKEGKKNPYLFWDKDEIIIQVKSFFKQVPSEINIEVLEKSDLSFIHYDDLQMLMKTFPIVHRSVNALIEDSHIRLEKRIIDFVSSTAENRYKNITTDFPNLIIKAPVELVATYLGVSRKTLNRIRTKEYRLK